MKYIQITMSEDELLGLWTTCQLAIDTCPEYVADEDIKLVEQLSEMYDSLKEHACQQ